MKKAFVLIISVSAVILLSSCGASQEAYEPQITDSMSLGYAEAFSVDYCADGTSLITVGDDRYLLVPEGMEAPDCSGVTILQQPVENIYMVSTSTMDMFSACNAMDSISYSSLKASDWYVEDAVKAMEEGSIEYAGKYSAPDYELLKSGGCGLAVENTMILHSPEIRETLESMGIPVIVDHSSYESTPQGRMEWIKLYGLLTGHLEEAENAFNEQLMYFDELQDAEDTGETVAFFYVTTAGTVSVRKDTDYIPKMIELAGGSYVYDGYGVSSDSSSPTANIQMESFYAAAKDADFLLYNSSISGTVSSIDDLLSLSPVFSSFKAVQTGNVYCTGENLYQSPMELGEFVKDLHTMISGSGEEMTYIFQLK